jgi:uncharacterized protein with PIN domain
METSPRFLTQWHLQKIARWLTIFGYPTRVVKELTKEDIAFCAAKRCTVLTTSLRTVLNFRCKIYQMH